jgi:hypothetical protein
MKALIIAGATLISLSLAGCATTSGSLASGHMKLTDPSHRQATPAKDTSSNELRRACADMMLNSSPAVEAKDIQAVVTSQSATGATVDVRATLLPTTPMGTDRPVAYRCVYQGTKLINAKWTAGL